MVAVLQHFKQANSGYIMPEFIMSNSEPESLIFTVRLDYRAVVVSRIEYAAPAWSGMCSAADRTRLDSLLRRSKWLGYCQIDQLEVADMFSASDDDFFCRIRTVITSYSHICLTITKFLTSCAHDPTHWL